MSSKKSTSSRTSRQTHRSTLSLTRTEIIINVYDLLPPGRLSSVLWTVGASLLHSGVVINGKEYAYGGHDRRGVTGVYWTQPGTEPAGGTFRVEILQGFTFAAQAEIDAIVRRASLDFDGAAYNILTRNCNHFTSHLCQRLTGRPGPGWLNRAASIGVAFPCVVPRDWVEPPDFDAAEGELLQDEDDSDADAHDESSRMLRPETRRTLAASASFGADEDELDDDRRGGAAKGKQRNIPRDSSGRRLPASERAPLAGR
ncbi:PPPDE putative peptidase domain-containing protein [Nemania serpens]|nr:PPPDE putative peptidase domain-containing protein [Nemania serpens]